MSDEPEEVPPVEPEKEVVPEKTEEQLLEEKRQQEEEARIKQEERKKLEEQARLKEEADILKLQEALKGSLSGLGKTADNRTIANIKLTLAEKQLQRIFPSILTYNLIQHLDLNTNLLTDVSIATEFEHLLTLNVSKNQIPDLSAFKSEQKLKKLQFLNVSTNKLKCISQIALPELRKLSANQNQIDSFKQWNGHAQLQILELRKNKFKKLKGICNLKNLKQLYICENEITDLRGLENLPVLMKLSLRNNQIKSFLSPFPYLPNLTHLNLRENKLTSLKELGKIDAHISSINLLANPVTDELGENFKKEVIWAFPHFIKVNKSAVMEEERVAFEKQRLQKLAQQEKQRLQKQQQARKAAEQEVEQPPQQ